MRRLLAIAVLATAVLTGAACSSKTDTGAAQSTPSASASASGSDSNATVCADVQRITVDAANAFAGQMTTIEAQVKAGDLSKLNDAVTGIKTFLNGWASSLRQEAAKAADPAMATSLNNAAAQVETVAGKINTAADLANLPSLMSGTELTAVGADLEQKCPLLATSPGASASATP